MLEIEEKQTLEHHVGFYRLSFVAVDEDGNESEPFLLMLHILPNDSLEEEQTPDQEPETEPDTLDTAVAKSVATTTVNVAPNPTTEEVVEVKKLVWYPDAPTVTITSVSLTGIVYLKFSEAMTLPSKIDEYFNDLQTVGRMLQENQDEL